MIAVILLAGKGRRISKDINYKHKALIEVYGRPLLEYLVDGLIEAGVTEIVAVLGYKSKKVERFLVEKFGKRTKITFVYNKIYARTNNLYSLYSARKHIEGKSFLIVNGDLALDAGILRNIVRGRAGTEIAIDDSKSFTIDSPRTLIRGKRILDLGRHITPQESGGYAIGVYRIDSKLSKDFLDTAKVVLGKDIKSGFHDPLRSLFNKRKIVVCSTKGMLWSDIDTLGDLKKIRVIIRKCYLERHLGK